MATSRENAISLISKINERINSLKYGENPEMHWEEIKKLEKTKSDLYENMNGFYDDALVGGGSPFKTIPANLFLFGTSALEGMGQVIGKGFYSLSNEPYEFKKALKENASPLQSKINENPEVYRGIDRILPEDLRQLSHEADLTSHYKNKYDFLDKHQNDFILDLVDDGLSYDEALNRVNKLKAQYKEKGKTASLKQAKMLDGYSDYLVSKADSDTLENASVWEKLFTGYVNGLLNLPTAAERALEMGSIIVGQDDFAQGLSDRYSKYEKAINDFAPTHLSDEASLSSKALVSIGENIPGMVMTYGLANANLGKLPLTNKISKALIDKNFKSGMAKVENGLGLKKGFGNLSRKTWNDIKKGKLDSQLTKFGLNENEILALKGEQIPTSFNAVAETLSESAKSLRQEADLLAQNGGSKLQALGLRSKAALNDFAALNIKAIPTAYQMSFRELYDKTCDYDQDGRRIVPDHVLPTMLMSLAHSYIEIGSGVDPTNLKFGWKSSLKKFIETALDEGKEEIEQSQIALMCKLLNDEIDNPKNKSAIDALTATAERLYNAEFDVKQQLNETTEGGIVGFASGLAYGGGNSVINGLVNGYDYVKTMNDFGFFNDLASLRDFQSYKMFSAFTDEQLQKQPEILAKELQDTENKLAKVKNMLSNAKSVEEQQELAKQKVELEKKLVSLPETIKAANVALQERVRQKENESNFNVLQAKELQEAEKLADLYRENGVDVNETGKPTFKNSPVDRIVSKVYDKLQKAGINVRIFDTAEQANKTLGTDYAENMEGVTDKNGDIVLIRSKLNSETNARYVLGHEITHRYLRNFLGEAKYKALVDKIHDSIYSEKPNPFQNMFYEILEAYSIKDENGNIKFLPQYDPNTESGQYALVEEILSRFAEMALFRPSGMKGFMKNILSGVIYDVKRGLNAFSKEDYKDLTANDVLHILRKEISSAEKGLNKGEFKGFYSGELYEQKQKELERIQQEYEQYLQEEADHERDKQNQKRALETQAEQEREQENLKRQQEYSDLFNSEEYVNNYENKINTKEEIEKQAERIEKGKREYYEETNRQETDKARGYNLQAKLSDKELNSATNELNKKLKNISRRFESGDFQLLSKEEVEKLVSENDPNDLNSPLSKYIFGLQEALLIGEDKISDLENEILTKAYDELPDEAKNAVDEYFNSLNYSPNPNKYHVTLSDSKKVGNSFSPRVEFPENPEKDAQRYDEQRNQEYGQMRQAENERQKKSVTSKLASALNSVRANKENRLTKEYSDVFNEEDLKNRENERNYNSSHYEAFDEDENALNEKIEDEIAEDKYNRLKQFLDSFDSILEQKDFERSFELERQKAEFLSSLTPLELLRELRNAKNSKNKDSLRLLQKMWNDLPQKTRQQAIKDSKNNHVGARYSLGQLFKEVEKFMPLDNEIPVLNKGKNQIESAKDYFFNKMPESVIDPETYQDENGNPVHKKILLRNPQYDEKGKYSKDKIDQDTALNRRFLHLIRSKDKSTGNQYFDIRKLEWVNNIHSTIENASLKLLDPDTGNEIFVRGFNTPQKQKHFVIVSPQNVVIEQGDFDEGLITQFQYKDENKQRNFKVIWEKNNKGLFRPMMSTFQSDSVAATKTNNVSDLHRSRNVSRKQNNPSEINPTPNTKISQEDLKEDPNSQVRYSLVTDKKLLDTLNKGETVCSMRSMQVIGKGIYPPMSAFNGENKTLVENTDFGTWYQSDERPEQIKYYDKDGVGKIDLNKFRSRGEEGALTSLSDVDYAPYWHMTNSPLNDQFSSAYKRPDLITVECEFPKSELTSGYKAKGARNAVGATDWHKGPVSAQLGRIGKPRIVYLSRWVKVNRIIPNAEAAKMIAEQLKDTGIGMPLNTVTPDMFKELYKLRVKFYIPPKLTTNDFIEYKDNLIKQGYEFHQELVPKDEKEKSNSKKTNKKQSPKARYSFANVLDEMYADALKKGDKKTQIQLVNKVCNKAVKNGIVPIMALGDYRSGDKDGLSKLARQVKEPEKYPNAVKYAAKMLAQKFKENMFPKNTVIVPAPNHHGVATDMLVLANEISKINGFKVADILGGKDRDMSHRAFKNKYGRTQTTDDMGLFVRDSVADYGDNTNFVILDNVINSGTTAKAAFDALGKEKCRVVCIGLTQNKVTVPELKLADRVTYDEKAPKAKSDDSLFSRIFRPDGEFLYDPENDAIAIPLSRRFDKTKYKPETTVDGVTRKTPDIRYSLAYNPMTESKQFKSWFGNSKVVDENGKPLVVYHGTDEEFTVFDENKSRTGMDIQGMFFSPWEIDAKGYGKNVGKFYLSIKNPAPESVAYKALNKFKGQNYAGKKAREYLESLGYDGVVNGVDGSPEEYIAFYPNQIKSATDNIGTFDKNNHDIRYSVPNLYTGSAADYEQPSLKYIGTGEGAQVYGWGLYATDNKEIAKWYAENDAERKTPKENYTLSYDGKNISPEEATEKALKIVNQAKLPSKMANETATTMIESYFRGPYTFMDMDSLKYNMLDSLNNEINNQKSTLSDLDRSFIDKRDYLYGDDEDGVSYLGDNYYKKSIERTKKRLSELDKSVDLINDIDFSKFKISSSRPLRNIYTQTFWASKDKHNLISWNDEIGKDNLEIIKNGLVDYVDNALANDKNNYWKNINPKAYNHYKNHEFLNSFDEFESGYLVYRSIAFLLDEINRYSNNLKRNDKSDFNKYKAASEFLDSIGIDGIKYPSNSYGRGDGSKGWNYVTFSDRDIKVTGHERYSLADTSVLGEGHISDKIKRFINELKGKKLTTEQKSIVKIFTRKERELKLRDLREVIDVYLKSVDKKYSAIHILNKHFKTEKHAVTTDEILNIANVIRSGKVDIYKDGSRNYIATAKDGAKLTVVVKKDNKNDYSIFTYFSDREAPPIRATKATSYRQGSNKKDDTSNGKNSQQKFRYSLSDDLKTKLIDDKYPLEQYQLEIAKKYGIKLTDNLNPYQDIMTKQGRLQHNLDDFKKTYWEPITKALALAKIPLEDLGIYAYAKHAPERNDYIKKIDPKNNNGSGWDSSKMGGTPEQIADELEKKYGNNLVNTHKLVKRLTEALLGTKLSYGLVDPKSYKKICTTYKDYVPLISEEDNLNLSNDMGDYMKGVAHATGRHDMADNPMTHLLRDIDSTFRNGENNLILNKVAALAFQDSTNPNGLIRYTKTVNKQQYEINRDPVTGKVTKRVVNIQQPEDGLKIPFRFYGAPYSLTINDEDLYHALMMGKDNELKGLPKELMKAYHAWFGITKALMTGAYPEFAFENLLRDNQTASQYFLMKDENYQGGTFFEFLKNTFDVLPAVIRNEFGKTDKTNENDIYLEEMLKNGGHSGYAETIRLENLQQTIENEIEETMKKLDYKGSDFSYNLKNHPIKSLIACLTTLSNITEMTTRLAAYKNARTNGSTARQAANFSKNITVNFDRQGSISRNFLGLGFNNIWMFSNAAIQSNYNSLKWTYDALKNQKTRNKALGIMATVFATGFALPFINASLGGDDDEDGMNKYDKIPDYIKNSHLVIVDPRKKSKYFLKYPIAPQLQFLFYSGRILGDYFRGRTKTLGKAISDIVAETSQTYNPFGNDNRGMLYSAVPTIVKPIADTQMFNSKWTGEKIKPYSEDSGVPNFKNYNVKKTSNALASLCKLLSNISGGSDNKGGLIDISPATIQHIAEHYSGGVGKFANNLYKTANTLIGKQEFDIDNIPFARRHIGELDDNAILSEYNGYREQANEVESEKKKHNSEWLKNNQKQVRLANMFNSYDKHIRNLRYSNKPNKEAEIMRFRKEFLKKANTLR